jgi:hypothetical protein
MRCPLLTEKNPKNYRLPVDLKKKHPNSRIHREFGENKKSTHLPQEKKQNRIP